MRGCPGCGPPTRYNEHTMLPGFATSGGTARFAARFPAQQSAGFFRQAQDVTVASLGLGTYLGEMDDATDHAYRDAAIAALGGGINVLDTSLNYRHQRSERALWAAIQTLTACGDLERDEFLVCTKAGYLTPDAVPPGLLAAEDVVGGVHSLKPEFLADQMERSRRNMGLATLDVFYLHNPETQLGFVSHDEFYQRMSRAFAFLERAAAEGHLRFYGTATWDGYRKPGALSLGRLVEIARSIAGDSHRFRFIQLPYNLAMTEALTVATGDAHSVLHQAEEMGITVVASASILQSRLAQGLPAELQRLFPGATTDAQRAIQFTRSAPGIAVALVGMSRSEHVAENLGISTLAPLSNEEYQKLLR